MKNAKVPTFPGIAQLAKATAPKRRYAEPTDIDNLKVEHDRPIPTARKVRNKYEPLFDKLKPGSCVTCEPKEVSRVGAAMRKYIATRGGAIKACVPLSATTCEDGKGRVWAKPKDAKK